MNFPKNIAVIGSGTAGITALSHLLAFMSDHTVIYSVYDPAIPMLGIGESTTTQIPECLYNGADLNLLSDSEELDATVKHGVRYVNWRSQDFHTYIPPPFYAMHFNNFKLKDVCFKKFKEKWQEKFQIIEGEITDLKNLEDRVICTISGKPMHFDYVIDCRGYPSTYEDCEIVDTIPVNHCLVHTINQPGDWTYTYHHAHPNGWMFGIPLKTRQGWGYLYNDTITTKEEAVKNIADIFQTSEDKLNLREFSFKNYRANKFIDGRIIKSGNRALFYEPIEALSGWFYDRIIRMFVDTCVANRYSETEANIILSELAEDYELFICFMYHGGSMYDSKFWKITQDRCDLKLSSSDRFKKGLNLMKESIDQIALFPESLMPLPVKTWKSLDKDLGFNYFTP